MKRFFFMLLFSYSSYLTYSQGNIDVLHYKFSIEVNDSNDTIYGQAEITLKILSQPSTIKFDLVKKNETGKGMMVNSITGPGLRGFVKDRDSVRIILMPGKEPAIGDTVIYTIIYHGIPADGLIISKNQYGNRTFFGDNWPNRAHNWLPCVDDIADKATVEFIVTAPSHYQVISNGVQIEETNLPGNKKLTHYKEDVPLPTKVMVIGVADFAVNNVGDINCVPVSSWVFPENKADGFYDYAQAKEIVAWYMNYIGPYPYKKLANIQSKTIFGGMENASAIFYFENSVTGKRKEEALLAHEIVHQWFGDMATEKSFAHLWLSEGFATYLTHIYIESKYGTDSLSKRMKNERDEVIGFVKESHRSVVDSTSNYMSLLNANSYQKGGWILHMLRRQLGDSIFHKSIKEYYSAYAGKNAETKDLQKVFESVSGKNLEQFFKQWLFTPENPSLDITWKYDLKKKEVKMQVKQLQANNFVFPFEVSFIAKSGISTNKKLVIDKKESDFVFPFAEKPKYVVADPFTSLLFEGKITELQ